MHVPYARTVNSDLPEALRTLTDAGVTAELRVGEMTATCRLSVPGHAVCVVSPTADDAVARALDEWARRGRIDRGKTAKDLRGHTDAGTAGNG